MLHAHALRRAAVSINRPCMQDIAAGEVLVRVPPACQLDHVPALRFWAAAAAMFGSALQDSPLLHDGPDVWQQLLAVKLLMHRRQGGSSRLAPYVAALPGIAPGVLLPRNAAVFAQARPPACACSEGSAARPAGRAAAAASRRGVSRRHAP